MRDRNHCTETSDLWRRYREEGDERARERLLLTYAPLVRQVAGRMASRLPAHVDEGDLVAYGLEGLMSAMERFDRTRQVRFETFAATRIRGAIVDALRSLDWVPRSVRETARRVHAANEALEHRLHRRPTDAETAAALGVTVDALRATLAEISNVSTVALDGLWGAPGTAREPLLETIEDAGATEPGGELDRQGTGDYLAEAVASLPHRERMVVGLYYYEDVSLSDIGDVLGVTESRASQLRTRGIQRLRSMLGGDRALLAASS